MRGKYIPPSIKLTAFNCPHCGALAKQFWFSAHADRYAKDGRPHLWTSEEIEEYCQNVPQQVRASIREKVEKLALRKPFIEEKSDYRNFDVPNLFFSQCYNCDNLSIWIFDRLCWPQLSEAPEPNQDLPQDVRADYDEAGLVLNSSPRAAAALLRQAVQRLCKHLGEAGSNINDDIAALVRKGLDPRVQKALDVVRVIGNNAVHPGQIDLRDNRETAEKLFGLVNIIADIMITQPRHIDSMFEDLPEGARKAIEKRDAPKMIEDKSLAK